MNESLSYCCTQFMCMVVIDLKTSFGNWAPLSRAFPDFALFEKFFLPAYGISIENYSARYDWLTGSSS